MSHNYLNKNRTQELVNTIKGYLSNITTVLTNLASGDARDNTKVEKSGDTMTGSLKLKPTSNSGSTKIELQSTAIDRDGADPASNITSNSEIVMLDKDGERLARIVVSRQTTGEQRLIISAYNEASGVEKANTFRLSVLKDGTVDYALTDPGKFRSVIGAAPANHNQASSTINAMTGYSKPATTSAIETSDTLNAAIGKLEKENEILRNALSQSTFFIPVGTTTVTSATITDKTKCYYYIPDSVTGFGTEAFKDCTSLIRITIPSSVTNINFGMFSGCTSLTSITMPNGVTSIEGDAFDGCTSLISITIPNSVTEISDNAFYDCSSLTGITIPNSVTSIGDDAFYGCTSLINITVNKPRDSISGAPWGAPNATVTWTG